MKFQPIFLVAAPAEVDQGIVLPWFVIGCVLLLVAIVAFFWAFALGKLSPSRHFLLMWILPLTSGFATGCFVGSLNATGPIGQIAVTATGGFAVWVLSYFLLPKPSAVPSDSVSTNLPSGMSFRDASKFLANLDGYDLEFTGFDNDCLECAVSSGQMTAGGVPELIDKLKHRLTDKSIRIEYSVERDSERGLYKVVKR